MKDIEKNTNRIESVEQKPLLKTDNLNEVSGKDTKKQISFDDSISKSEIPPEEKKELTNILATATQNGEVKKDLENGSIETLDENANVASKEMDEVQDKVDKNTIKQGQNDNDHEEVKSKAENLRKLVEAQKSEKDELKIVEENDKSPEVKKVLENIRILDPWRMSMDPLFSFCI